MNSPARGATFTLKRVQEMLGLSRAVVVRLIDAGFVSPTRGARNEHRFSFQDVLLLRTAQALRAADIPPRKILKALTRLRATLPEQIPLTGLRITAVGADVAVRDRDGQLEAETGQLLMDFEVAPAGASVVFLEPAASSGADDPAEWFQRGEAAEEGDPAAAEAAYRRVLELAPDHLHAHLNLGALLCETQRCPEAAALYDEALPKFADEPLIHFNLAVAREGEGRLADAIASYEHSLVLDPALADAHYNVACLMERQGDGQGALRHFNAYRRLQRG